MIIRSEIAPLQQVIIHQPGDEHTFTLPENTYEWMKDHEGKMVDNPDYLLFDDLISPRRIVNEHSELAKILQSFTGKTKTYQFKDLLSAIITDQHVKEEILLACSKLDQDIYGFTTQVERDLLLELEPVQLANVLISGRLKGKSIQHVFKWPLPNLIFTRDIGAMIGRTFLTAWAMRKARKREMLLMQFIADHHPLFAKTRKFHFHTHFPELALEGGDIIIFDDKTIFFGLGERNSKDAIEGILPLCFQEQFERVIVVDLPKLRSLMHLDTSMSKISANEILVYPPLFNQQEMKGHPISFYKIEKGKSLFDVQPVIESLDHCLKSLGYDFIPIYCGGNEPIYQEREQWTDGANAFTLQPGKIISYSRNRETLAELTKSGYEIVTEKKIIAEPDNYIQKNNKLVITISSAEMPRGRGGPRCLTLPLSRS